MADPTQQTSKHPKSYSDNRRNGGGSRHNSETDNPPSSSSATPTATPRRADTATPARPGSSLAGRVANSTPRLRSRPAPVRSLSSPLGRSLSMRVSKKEKRWSMRLEDPKSLVTSTYKDDYQSPETLSLHSLNLETTTDQLGNGLDLNAPTTYRESYRWQPRQPGDRGRLRSPSDDKDTPSSKAAVTSDHSLDGFPTGFTPGPASPTGTASRNGQASGQHSQPCEQTSAGRPAVQSPTSRHSASFFRRNASSGVIQSGGNDGQSLPSTDRTPRVSANKDLASVKSANGKDMSITKPPSEKGTVITPPANERGMAVTRPANEKGVVITRPANEKGVMITRPTNERGMSIPAPASERGMAITSPANERGMAIARPTNERGMAIARPTNERGMAIARPTSEKGVVITRPANGISSSVNGEDLVNSRTPQTQKLTNGVRGWSVAASESENRTPRHTRAYQLQSSTGGSPFAYGSDSGAWV